MATTSRAILVTILYRLKGDPALSFTDAESVSDWARDAMTWAVGAELINGVGDNKLEPEDDAQRAQSATILYRFFN